jgi:PKD repeat protein
MTNVNKHHTSQLHRNALPFDVLLFVMTLSFTSLSAIGVNRSEKRSAGTSYDFSALGVNVAAETKSTGTGPSVEEAAEAEREAAALLGGRVLRNQFNFSERATQTFNNPMRDRKVATEPPPRSNFSANVTHWEIYDTYMEDFDRQMLSKNTKERKVNPAHSPHPLPLFSLIFCN